MKQSRCSISVLFVQELQEKCTSQGVALSWVRQRSRSSAEDAIARFDWVFHVEPDSAMLPKKPTSWK